MRAIFHLGVEILPRFASVSARNVGVVVMCVTPFSGVVALEDILASFWRTASLLVDRERHRSAGETFSSPGCHFVPLSRPGEWHLLRARVVPPGCSARYPPR